MKKLENAFEVAEHTDAMLAFWDKDLVCRFANSTYIKWFGLSPTDMIDKITLPELLGPLYQLNSPFITKALEGKVQIFERDITLPNGETKNTIATYSPHIRNGTVTGFYVHVADISPVKNELLQGVHNVEDHLMIPAAHHYLNGVEHTLRSSLFTKFPGILALAKQYFISATKLKKDFRQRYHTTILSYYRSLQMQVAHKYVTGKIYSKSQLAEMFKFDNPSNFSNCYNKYTLAQRDSIQSDHSIKDISQELPANPGLNTEGITLPRSEKNWEKKYHQLEDQLTIWMKCAPNLRIGTWERNLKTMITEWDAVTKAILEIPPEFEPDINPALNFYKEGADRELAKKCLRKAYTKGEPFDFQAQVITAKGTEKRVRVLGFCLLENKVCTKMYGILQEILQV